MNKVRLMKPVNIALGVSFLVQVITSLMLFFEIVESHAVAEVHEYNGLLMITLAFVHIWLNWGWIRANILKRAARAEPSKQ